MSAAKPSTRDDAAASAGRGVVFIGAAKLYFLVAGFAIETALTHLLGKYGYGAYKVVGSLVSPVNNVMVTGTIQAVSRQISADPEHPDAAVATGLKMHLWLGVGLALAFAAIAPVVAFLLKDPGKAGPFALSAAIVAAYSIYAVLVGATNGTRQFHKQAGLDMTFATMRAVCIVGAVVLGLGVYGAIGGWVVAAALIVVVAFLWVGGARGASARPVRPMVMYLLGLAAYLGLTNLFLFADVYFLKVLSTGWFVAHGHDAATAAREADGQVGLYGAVLQLARMPYQVMIAVTFVIFPLISRATFENDTARASGYVGTTMRLSLLFAGLMGAVLAAHPTPILDILYPAEYAANGGPALTASALGHVAFVVFTIGATILNSAGRTRETILVTGASLLTLVVALWITLPRLAPGPELLLGAACCTAGGMALGALVTGMRLRTHFGVFLRPLTVLRVLAAVAAAWAVCRFVPQRGPILALAGAALAAVAYLATLVVTGELGRADVARVLSVARRSKT